MATVGDYRTVKPCVVPYGLLSCEDYFLNWLTLGHFMVCRRMGCDSSSRNSLAVDSSRFW